MPRPKAVKALAGLVESDSEPDLDHFDAAEVQAVRTANVPKSAAKKPRGRPPSSDRVTKPTPKARRVNGRAAAEGSSPKQASPETGNSGKAQTSREMEEQAKVESTDTSAVEPPSSVASVRTKASRGRPKASKAETTESASKVDDLVAPGSTMASATKRRGRPPTRRPAPIPEEIPETQQPEPMDLDIVPEEEEDEELVATAETTQALIGGDMSDVVAVRRRLGDLTKKYENLEMRHRDLREIGVKEAERNFERLRKQSEERTAVANKLIAELKAELTAQTTSAKHGQKIQKQLEASEANAEDLQATIDKLNASLSEARGEIKTLSTKLAASRSAEVTARVPGSAMKPSAVASRAAQAEAVQAAQAKEDLYADLTGLIMRGVRREELEDVFDCIQTGRNGTLHFKLAVENTNAAESYEDVQFTYRPQLNSDRDEALIEMLPDYLVEEITFPRPQASRFYARVIKSLTERVE